MKQFLLFVLVSFFSTGIHAQDMISALRNGNAKELATYFDQSVKITIGDKNYTANKKIAEESIKAFFNQAEVKNFQVIHKSDNTSSQYYIGNLTTTSGIYRTTIFLKQKENNNLVQEIRFEK